MLALNILGRSYGELWSPLDYQQVAPILFLYLEKLFSLITYDADYALRIVPLISFVGSIYLTYRVAISITNDIRIGKVAVSIFCLCPMLLAYSSEVKPYMSDVFILLLLIYLMFQFKEKFGRKICSLTLIGTVAIFFSYPSVIVLATLGPYLLYKNRNDLNKISNILLMSLIWLVAFLANYFFLISTNIDNGGLSDWWGVRFSYLPLHLPDFWLYMPYIMKVLAKVAFGWELHSWEWKPFALLYIGSLGILLWTRQFAVIYLICFPLLIHLGVSHFKLYPFAPRLILYQAPLFIIIVSVGIVYLANVFHKIRGSLVVMYLPAVFLLNTNYPTFYEHDHGMKPALQYLREHVKSEDAIYLYSGAKRIFEYYKKAGLAPDNDFFVTKQKANLIDGRMWAIFDEIDRQKEDELDKERTIIERFNKNGFLIDSKEFSGSAIYLFYMGKTEPLDKSD
jgi:hypothetical protein